MNAYLINYVQRGFFFFFSFARCSSVYVLSWWGLYCLVFIWYLINVVSFLLNCHLGSFVVQKYYFYISGLLTCKQLCYTVKTPGHNPRIQVNLSAFGFSRRNLTRPRIESKCKRSQIFNQVAWCCSQPVCHWPLNSQWIRICEVTNIHATEI